MNKDSKLKINEESESVGKESQTISIFIKADVPSPSISEGDRPPTESKIAVLDPVYTYEDKEKNIISLVDPDQTTWVEQYTVKNYLQITEDGRVEEVLNPINVLKSVACNDPYLPKRIDPNFPNGVEPTQALIYAFSQRSVNRSVRFAGAPTAGAGPGPSHPSSSHSNSTLSHIARTNWTNPTKSSILEKSGPQERLKDFMKPPSSGPEQLYEFPMDDYTTARSEESRRKGLSEALKHFARVAIESGNIDTLKLVSNEYRKEMSNLYGKKNATKVVASIQASYEEDRALEQQLRKAIKKAETAGAPITPQKETSTIPDASPNREPDGSPLRRQGSEFKSPEENLPASSGPATEPPASSGPATEPPASSGLGGPPASSRPGGPPASSGPENSGPGGPPENSRPENSGPATEPPENSGPGGPPENSRPGGPPENSGPRGPRASSGPASSRPENSGPATEPRASSGPGAGPTASASQGDKPAPSSGDQHTVDSDASNLEPPNEPPGDNADAEAFDLGNLSKASIKIVPLGLHFNTRLGRIKINPNVRAEIDPSTGLPSGLKYGIDFNANPDLPVAGKISIHQGSGTGLHHSAELAIKNDFLKFKGETGTTNSKNYWEASGKIDLAKIKALEDQSERFREFLPPELRRLWRTPSVGFGFGSNDSLKMRSLRDLQNIFVDADSGPVTIRLPLWNKQVDLNEQILLVRQLAGLYGNPSIEQLANISRLAALLGNPTIRNIGQAISVGNSPGTGRNATRALNDNLSRLQSSMDNMNGRGHTTKNLVEQSLENQNNLLREIRQSNEADCCEEMIARLGRVEAKIDDLLPSETTSDDPLAGFAGAALLGTALFFTKNLVITVFVSLTVGTVGGIINYHVIRLTRTAQREKWKSYPVILILRFSFTVFSMATTIILVGNLFNNAVRSQSPMTELPFLKKIPAVAEYFNPAENGHKGVQWYLHPLSDDSTGFVTIIWHRFGATALIGFQILGIVFIFLRITKGGDVSRMVLESIGVLIIQAKSVTVCNYISEENRDTLTWKSIPGFFHISVLDVFKYYIGLGALVINAFRRTAEIE